MVKKIVAIGTSGWSYDHWGHNFYPADRKKNEWLSYYASFFDTVELNMSFYRTPFPNMVKSWLKKTPDDFIFSIKASRYITHIKKLVQIEESMNKLYTLVKSFNHKAKAILFQLPPFIPMNEHNVIKVKKLIELINPDYDTVIEFRHHSWWDGRTYDMLRDKATFCIVNGLGMPDDFVATTDVVYFRFHGDNYGSLYSEYDLQVFLEKLDTFAAKHSIKRIYIYFNNDCNGYAIVNAQYLKKICTSNR